jgi:4-hydroxyproline epimerase
VIGDIAWGGNWFFLVKNSQEKLCVSNAGHLTEVTKRIKETLESTGIGGADGPIDHIELFTKPQDPVNQSRNFVLCPGGAYDRSPCGTGTSAKLACLAADGLLAPGEIWRQEGILGTVFSGSFRNDEVSESIIPTIEGEAYICGESDLILDSDDPFRMGITS